VAALIESVSPRSRWLVLWAIVTVAAAASLYGGRAYFPGAGSTAAADKPAASIDQQLTSCIKETSASLDLNTPEFTEYWQIWNLCGNQVYNILLLDDFLIRREKFIRQELDERVTLWMVVTITISGVLLAGLQLAASYKLATAGRGELANDNTLKIEKDKIFLKSSVTGTVILAISLAFFIVYVLFIYSIKEIPIERPANLSTSPPSEERAGGLGAAMTTPVPQLSAPASANVAKPHLPSPDPDAVQGN
jgi:hypothetical protein